MKVLKIAKYIFHSVIVDGKKVFIKQLLLVHTKGILFGFLEEYLLVVPGIISLKYLSDILLNILQKLHNFQYQRLSCTIL